MSPSPGTTTPVTHFQEVIPSSFRLPNLIVAGAVDQAGDETGFTSYGDNVLVHADGQAVESVVPGGATGKDERHPRWLRRKSPISWLNCSQSIQKALPSQLIKTLIRDGSDASDDGRRHLMNPKRST